jgi:putative ABC transport system substrate-binding protein
MKRREFITLLGGAAAWPLAARAQQRTLVIGFLSPFPLEAIANRVAGFRNGLRELGYVEGRDVSIEWSYADNSRLPELAADLVRHRVDLIVASPGNAALAAKAATTTIPIIFFTGSDPVQIGFTATLNRPSGNMTGVTTMNLALTAKRLGLLSELLPKAVRLAVLVDSNIQDAEITIRKEAYEAGKALGREVGVLAAKTSQDIDSVFANWGPANGLLVSPAPLFTNRRVQLVTLAAYHRVPTAYFAREFAEIGGMMSYGTSETEQYRQIGIYAGRILRGEKLADLPVMQPTKFELVVNLQTMRTLGITAPSTLLATADEIIE